jgi:glycerol-3-phosphate dehydrogenase (NAD(P)+)
VLEAKKEQDPAGTKMWNYAAAIFAQGLSEIAAVVTAMGGGPETVFSLPGAGDLYVTSLGGRNARMGRLLGLGMTYSSAVEEMPGETIEGVDAVLAIGPAIEKMIEQGRLAPDSMPLLRKLYRIVTRGEAVDFDFNSFFRTLPLNPPETAQSE